MVFERHSSHRAHERLVGNFPGSPWVDEARYGMGWAYQQQKQYDQAGLNAAHIASAALCALGIEQPAVVALGG